MNWLSVGSVTAVLLVWAVATSAGWVTAVPSPAVLGETLANLTRSGYSGHPLWQHVLASMLRSLVGLVSGIAAGVVVGLVMGTSDAVASILAPFFSFLRPIPLIAFIPLFVAYFGIGEFPKILVIFLAAFWYVVLNTTAGVRTVPRDWLRAAENFGLRGWSLIREIVFPAALPSIMSGVRTAAAIGWAVVVTAELVAAQVGLGYMIEDASTFFNIPVVYIGIGIIGVIGVLMELGLNLIDRRMLHWAGR